MTASMAVADRSTAVGCPASVISSEIVIVDAAGNEEPYDPSALDAMRPLNGSGFGADGQAVSRGSSRRQRLAVGSTDTPEVTW